MKDIFDKTDHFKERENILSHLLYGNPDDCPNPLVSIIMPVYNRPDTFPASLASALNQQCDFPFEIVVVDNKADGERTESQHIVEATGVKNIMYYRNEENLGMYDNWNRGIWLSRGKYVTYCHDDDMLLPDALQRLVNVSRIIGESKAIFTKYNMIDENGNIINKYAFPHRRLGFLEESEYQEFSTYDQFIGSYSFGNGCLFKRENLIAIGGFDRDYYPAADAAAFAKYTYYYGSVVINNPTFIYRIAQNASRNIETILSINEQTYRIRKEIMNVLHIPNFVLRPYAEAMHRLTPHILMNNYEIEDKSRLPKIHKCDRVIKRIFAHFSRNKGYKIKF